VRPASYATAAPAPAAAPLPAAFVAPERPAAAAVPAASSGNEPWDQGLRHWADSALQSGRDDLLGEATPMFERVMIEAALTATRGQRQEAARRLGWGRNTLSRKIKELGLGEDE
jgi:two-component system nitrogen regulation response regulator GlnG